MICHHLFLYLMISMLHLAFIGAIQNRKTGRKFMQCNLSLFPRKEKQSKTRKQNDNWKSGGAQTKKFCDDWRFRCYFGCGRRKEEWVCTTHGAVAAFGSDSPNASDYTQFVPKNTQGSKMNCMIEWEKFQAIHTAIEDCSAWIHHVTVTIHLLQLTWTSFPLSWQHIRTVMYLLHDIQKWLVAMILHTRQILTNCVWKDSRLLSTVFST